MKTRQELCILLEGQLDRGLGEVSSWKAFLCQESTHEWLLALAVVLQVGAMPVRAHHEICMGDIMGLQG